jgi:hypothetical protein
LEGYNCRSCRNQPKASSHAEHARDWAGSESSNTEISDKDKDKAILLDEEILQQWTAQQGQKKVGYKEAGCYNSYYSSGLSDLDSSEFEDIELSNDNNKI